MSKDRKLVGITRERGREREGEKERGKEIKIIDSRKRKGEWHKRLIIERESDWIIYFYWEI